MSLLTLFFPFPGLRTAQQACLVQRAAQDEFVGLGVVSHLAKVGLLAFGIVNFALEVFAMNLHVDENLGTYDAFPLFRIGRFHHNVFSVGILFVHADDFAVINAVFLGDADAGALVARLVVDGIPIAEHLPDLGMGKCRRGEEKE